MTKILWKPTNDEIVNSEMYKFILNVGEKYRLGLTDYDSFYSFSIEEPELFWSELLLHSGIKFSGDLYPVLVGEEMFGSKWFSNVKLNFAENLLRFRGSESIAIVSYNEQGKLKERSYTQLFSDVLKVRGYLENLGITQTDVIAGFSANCYETVVAMLATVSLGAAWTSCSADFGAQGVIDRFGQTKPKILFATSSYYYNGKNIDCNEKIEDILKQVPSIERIVRLSDTEESTSAIYTTFSSLLKLNESLTPFKKYDFNHPLYIMYSSGTTGKPKCIVHGAGGTLLQHYKEIVLHTNVSSNDSIFYYTTCGWMMWNWLISSLFTGAKVVLYDGSPIAKGEDTLWNIADKEGISVFGTSPKYLSILEKNNYHPKQYHLLKELKTLLSTGAPLSSAQFRFVYENIKNDVRLSSISGGTDIISCFMLGSPLSPVYVGEIQKRGLGMAVESFDVEGNSVRGIPGELCCVKSFPSMPIYFNNDISGEKYRNAYFTKYNGVWWHGDYIEITENNGVVVYGRSDATLNPGGVRIGSSEIYEIVEHLEFIQDSLVVGHKTDEDIEIILFVVMQTGNKLDLNKINEIKNRIKLMSTPRHVPAKIIEILDVPRTISGKKVELAVTKILNNGMIDNLEALANPESLQIFYDIAKKI